MDMYDYSDYYSNDENATIHNHLGPEDSGILHLCHNKNVINFGKKYLPTLFYINFIISILGNGLVLYILLKYEKLGTIINIFLFNLLISNLIFAFTLPFKAFSYSSDWIFGWIMCKLVSSLFAISFYSSILFITLLTFDRYLTIIHPTKIKHRTLNYAISFSLIMWIISLVASIKELVLYTTFIDPKEGFICNYLGNDYESLTKWKLFGYYQQVIIFFLIPLSVIIFCYVSIAKKIIYMRVKNQFKSLSLIFLIVLIFFICWTPYNIVIFLQATEISPYSTDCPPEILDYAHFITRNLAFLYCCISPLIYVFLSKTFKNHFKKLLTKYIPFLKSFINTQDDKTMSFDVQLDDASRVQILQLESIST